METRAIAGRYELIEEVSSGGMGTVWRGYDAVLDREVAVKLIRPDMVATAQQAEELAKRFRREARVTARIQHHGVPQVYDAVLDRPFDRLCLVMELVRGTPLRAFINPQRPLPITWAAAVAAQICTVLSHAHAVPVVHRDLKPDNVLVADDGTVKVLDFGIAAILRTDVTRLTATGTPLGTSQYMSPEQIQGAQISPHSDLYALGCMLHELLAGRPVVNGDNDFARMRQHIDMAPEPLRELRANVPEAVEQLVLELLAKAPEQRPADAYEVYERLLPFLPLPGSKPDARSQELAGVPDPTLLYRRPNAPRPQRGSPLVRVSESAADDQVASATSAQCADLHKAMQAAVARSEALLNDERFAQAAEVLQAVIEPGAAALGAENPRVLSLRSMRAAILVLGGDFRRALPEFDALAAAYARTTGPSSRDALECVQQAAHCRAELGEVTAALRQFQRVLNEIRATDGDASATALDLRRNIGVLLLAEGKPAEAGRMLQNLYDDLCVVYGADHEDSREVRDVLARLRIAGS